MQQDVLNDMLCIRKHHLADRYFQESLLQHLPTPWVNSSAIYLLLKATGDVIYGLLERFPADLIACLN